MAETLSLKAQIRKQTGSKAAAKLRKKGQVPAVVYGHKQEAVAVSLDGHNFTEGIHHGNRLMDIQIGSKKEKTIVKDLQYDHLGKNIIHVDLMRVNITEKITVSVPVQLKGKAKGTEEGGVVEEHFNSIDVECLVTNIPEIIVISVKDLGVGDAIHAGDIELPQGVRLISSPDTLIVNCNIITEAPTTEELEEEAPAAPEVIGEAEKQEEQAESSGKKEQ